MKNIKRAVVYIYTNSNYARHDSPFVRLCTELPEDAGDLWRGRTFDVTFTRWALDSSDIGTEFRINALRATSSATDVGSMAYSECHGGEVIAKLDGFMDANPLTIAEFIKWACSPSEVSNTCALLRLVARLQKAKIPVIWQYVTGNDLRNCEFDLFNVPANCRGKRHDLAHSAASYDTLSSANAERARELRAA